MITIQTCVIAHSICASVWKMCLKLERSRLLPWLHSTTNQWRIADFGNYSSKRVYVSTDGSGYNGRTGPPHWLQESWEPIAKMTAQCALYMGALTTLMIDPGNVHTKFEVRSFTLSWDNRCRPTQQIWTVPGYVNDSKCLMGFCLDMHCESTSQIWSP